MCLCGTSVKHSGRALGVCRVLRQNLAKSVSSCTMRIFQDEVTEGFHVCKSGAPSNFPEKPVGNCTRHKRNLSLVGFQVVSCCDGLCLSCCLREVSHTKTAAVKVERKVGGRGRVETSLIRTDEAAARVMERLARLEGGPARTRSVSKSWRDAMSPNDFSRSRVSSCKMCIFQDGVTEGFETKWSDFGQTRASCFLFACGVCFAATACAVACVNSLSSVMPVERGVGGGGSGGHIVDPHGRRCAAGA